MRRALIDYLMAITENANSTHPEWNSFRRRVWFEKERLDREEAEAMAERNTNYAARTAARLRHIRESGGTPGDLKVEMGTVLAEVDILPTTDRAAMMASLRGEYIIADVLDAIARDEAYDEAQEAD